MPEGWKPRHHTHTVVVLVGTVNKGTLEALQYARSLAPDRLLAVSVVGDPHEKEQLDKAWAEAQAQHRAAHDLLAVPRAHPPMLQLPRRARRREPDDLITVVIPEFVVTGWYSQILHNQTALALKARLLFRPNTVVTSCPVLVE